MPCGTLDNVSFGTTKQIRRNVKKKPHNVLTYRFFGVSLIFSVQINLP
jgi:hypothetical protein